MVDYEIKPKIAIITQALDLNDSVLGFFHNWVAEFAKRCQKVFVITLKKGACDLPNNVKIYQLPTGKLKRYLGFRAAMLELIEEQGIEHVFTHMCPIYTVAAAWYTKPAGIPLTLWFAHGNKSNLLKLATALADETFSCSTGSFPISSNKLTVVGHGIDLNKFNHATTSTPRKDGELRIVSTGRINDCKNYEVVIRAIDIINKTHPELKPYYKIVGEPTLPEDIAYQQQVKNLIQELHLNDQIELSGPVDYAEIENCYHWCDINTNMTCRLALDKSVLECMACEKPVITTNRNYDEVLAEFADLTLCAEMDSEDMANKIIAISQLSDAKRNDLGKKLRKIIIQDHSLEQLINRLMTRFKRLKPVRALKQR